MIVGGIVVVAGLSSRMNDFKPLLPLGDRTIVETTINNLEQSGIDEIVVVVGHRGNEIECIIKNKNVNVVWNYDYKDSDMFQSVKIGIESLERCNSFFVVPGDMPLISNKTFKTLIRAMETTNAKVVFPTIDNRLKHPPLIHINCIEGICNYKGDYGLRGALKQFSKDTFYVPVKDIGCGIDVDTPSDYMRILELN